MHDDLPRPLMAHCKFYSSVHDSLHELQAPWGKQKISIVFVKGINFVREHNQLASDPPLLASPLWYIILEIPDTTVTRFITYTRADINILPASHTQTPLLQNILAHLQ